MTGVSASQDKDFFVEMCAVKVVGGSQDKNIIVETEVTNDSCKCQSR